MLITLIIVCNKISGLCIMSTSSSKFEYIGYKIVKWVFTFVLDFEARALKFSLLCICRRNFRTPGKLEQGGQKIFYGGSKPIRPKKRV